MEVNPMFQRITVLLGVFAALSMVVAGIWSWKSAAQLAESAGRPDVTLWAVRSAAVAVIAAAQETLARSAINETTFKEASALLKAAATLNPREPRFPRLLAEASLQLGDKAGAIEALKLASAADPDDQVVLTQLIDLYTASMQS